MNFLLLGLQVMFAAILAVAAVSKLIYPQQILTALRQSSTPPRFTAYLATIVILLELEIALAVLFSTSWSLSLAFLSAFILLGIFTIWILWVLRQNLQVSCGCFGPSHARVNKKYLVRNGCFLGLALGGFLLSLFTRSILPDPSTWILVVMSCCLPVALGLGRWRFRHHQSNHLEAVP